MDSSSEKMMAVPLAAHELEDVAVFPLSGAVLFPGTSLALHLFEDRYRTMMRDCVARGSMVMAVTQSVSPGDMETGEGFREMCGVGRIVSHEAMDDGRFNIVLQGMDRCLLEPLAMENSPYMRARVRTVADEGAALPSDMATLLSCASTVASRIKQEHSGFSLQIPAKASTSRMADLIADQLVADVDVRQRILETRNVKQRVQLVVEAVGELSAVLLHGSARRDSWC